MCADRKRKNEGSGISAKKGETRETEGEGQRWGRTEGLSVEDEVLAFPDGRVNVEVLLRQQILVEVELPQVPSAANRLVGSAFNDV